MPQPVNLKKLKLNGSMKTTRPSRTNTKKEKGCPFHHRGLECRSRKSRDTWGNRQVWPFSTKWSRAKADRVCEQSTLVIANTLFHQHKRRLYTWTSPNGHYWNQIDYILCSQAGVIDPNYHRELRLLLPHGLHSTDHLWFLCTLLGLILIVKEQMQ